MPIRALKRRDFLKNGTPMRVHRVLQQPSISAHRHEFFEIVIVVSGSGTHVTGSFRRRVEAGDVMVINPKRAHAYEDAKQLNLINLLIRESVLKRMGRELRLLPGFVSLFDPEARRWRMKDDANRLKLSVHEREQVEEWVNRIEEESGSDSPGSSYITEAYLTLIIAVLARKQRRSDAVKFAVPRPLATFGKLQSWLEKNLHQPLSIADLAKQTGMSERSFYRSFQRVMGCTPTSYLNQLRIERAVDLLQESPRRRRISEIGEQCGFGDSNYFSRTFRRWKGCSPSAFGDGV